MLFELKISLLFSKNKAVFKKKEYGFNILQKAITDYLLQL